MTADFQNREAEEAAEPRDEPLDLEFLRSVALSPALCENDPDAVLDYLTQATDEIEALRAAYERVVAERDEARADAEQARLAIALSGGGIDPEGYYAGTPGSRLKEMFADIAYRKATEADLQAEIARLRSDLNQATAALPLLWALYEAYRDSGNVEPSREEMDAGYVELVSREDSLRVGSAFEAIFDRESEIRALIDAFRSSHFPAS